MMTRNGIILTCLLLFSTSLSAQEGMKKIPVSIGYYGPYAIQPGGKIGTSFTFREWQAEKDLGKNLMTTYAKSLLISPQIGVFGRSGNHISFLLNADAGYRILNEERQIYSAFSLGLGYLAAYQRISNTIDLGSGEMTDKNRERRDYFLPTLGYEFGREAGNKTGWYAKISYGRKMSADIENSGFFALEFGLKFQLIKIGKA